MIVRLPKSKNKENLSIDSLYNSEDKDISVEYIVLNISTVISWEPGENNTTELCLSNGDKHKIGIPEEIFTEMYVEITGNIIKRIDYTSLSLDEGGEDEDY